MHLSKYRPLTPSGRYPAWVTNLKGSAGVYAIRCKRSKRVLYVGASADQLYDTMTRHFQGIGSWFYQDGSERPTYARSSVEVAVLATATSFDAHNREKYYICELDPSDNTLKTCEREEREERDEVPF